MKSSLPIVVGAIIAATAAGAVGGMIVGARWLATPTAPPIAKEAPPPAANPAPPPAAAPVPPPAPAVPAPAPTVASAVPPAAPAAPPVPRDPNAPPQPSPVPAPPGITVAALPPAAQPPAAVAPEAAPPAPSSASSPAAPPSTVSPPLAPPSTAELPPWRRYAVAVAVPPGKPMIAIIIDDMGLDRKRSAEAVALPGPLTLAFMAYAQNLPAQTEAGHAHGHELLVHVPMEPLDSHVDPGPNALTTALSPAEIERRLDGDLAGFTGYVGINNHEGSRFTADAAGMQVVLDDLKRRGLLFIDSRTTAKSVGLNLALKDGVPAAGRDIFLDDQPDLASVRRQLALVEAEAKKRGTVIATGHPKDATIAALAAWLPTLAAKGFALVPVSAVVAARLEAAPTAALAPVAAANPTQRR